MIPIKRNGFFLEKQAFWDAIRIRYDMSLERLPKLCVCGDSFNLQNASIEPLLTPLTEEDFLNLQIRATKQEQMCQLEV